MKNLPIPRLDRNQELREYLLRFARIKEGELWRDPTGKQRVGCLDAANADDVEKIMGDDRAALAVHDPPYNLVAFEPIELQAYIRWCRQWIDNTWQALSGDGALYVWLGADQTNGFQPLPDFMLMMRETGFKTRSFITMRNQRGYGTHKNWMAVRQELLYYTKGSPQFNVAAEYTEIPKILRGYYKQVNGRITENLQRSRSENIRAGNVWVDIQQVFYRMVENVNGCYAQKPLKSAERIIQANSKKGQLVIDFFCHSGSTMLACEVLDRKCYTLDSDPIYCEIAIRRLERYRLIGKTGWQNTNPFEEEMRREPQFRSLIGQTNSVEPEENPFSLA